MGLLSNLVDKILRRKTSTELEVPTANGVSPRKPRTPATRAKVKRLRQISKAARKVNRRRAA